VNARDKLYKQEIQAKRGRGRGPWARSAATFVFLFFRRFLLFEMFLVELPLAKRVVVSSSRDDVFFVEAPSHGDDVRGVRVVRVRLVALLQHGETEQLHLAWRKRIKQSEADSAER